MAAAFVHHVFFWLKEPGNTVHRQLLVEGLQKLSRVTTIQSFHIGVPAGTSRPVIDSTYAVSWLLTFNSAADQDSYQTDPIHLDFIKECSGLWDKVVVYDTIPV
ncbi:MAG: Dabb family protein [Bacteroidetes bacterium]|nr:Dabb family protein [Bacteroidota bacterium]